MGDPCGVGPEVLVRALADPAVIRCCVPVVLGDVTALRRAVKLCGGGAEIFSVSSPESVPEFRGERPAPIFVFCRNPLSDEDIEYGNPSAKTCAAIIDFIETAVDWALKDRVAAVVTAPIHKESLHRNGFPFPGHTEFLQDLCGVDRVVMMLAGPRLRVSLATIHCALREVPDRLSPDLIQQTIEITGQALERDFAMDAPRLAVAGLNPHAGEGGRFGDEEKKVIEPAVRFFSRHRSWRVTGPYPPDTVFFRAYAGEFDGVVAMYHDQGLIPLKLVHFDEGVNVTLGLPIVRTSVDHGTAYDIAGRGIARPTSMIQAIRTAVSLAENRRKRACE